MYVHLQSDWGESLNYNHMTGETRGAIPFGKIGDSRTFWQLIGYAIKINIVDHVTINIQ